MFIQLMVVNTLFAMITAYLISIFLKSNLHIFAKRSSLVVFFILFGASNGVLSTLLMEYLPSNLQFVRPLALLVLSVIIVKYILNTGFLNAVLSFCTIMLAVASGNFVAPIIFALFTNVNVTPSVISNDIFMYTLMSALIYLISTILVLLTPFAKKISQVKNLKPVGFLLSITLLIMGLNAGVHYIVSFDPISFFATLMLSLIYLITSIWYINNYHKYEMKIEEEKQQAFYNESLGLVIQDLRRFKHDQANHLTVISAMIKMKKYDQATSYINEIFNTTESIVDSTICDIKNAGLFGLITSKIDNAQKSGIKFSLNTVGEIDSIPSVKISDLCEVIGIFLDNAIEAALISDIKEVEMSLKSEDDILDITINNSCGTIPDTNVIKQDGYSTKGSNRGHGLNIVEKILDKYDNVSNTLKFDTENMRFIQCLKIKKGQ